VKFRYLSVGDREWRYPDTGLVVVTGKNGSGKSTSVVEARAWALFGKMTRGTPPPPGWVVGAEVDTGNGVVEIERDVRKLVWANAGEKPVQWETPTKAKEALLQRVGVSLDAWAHTTVFTSQGVGAFTGASDTARKTLVESLMGLDRLARAYTLALREKSAAESAETDISVEAARAVADLDGARRQLALVESLTVVEPDVVQPPDPQLKEREADLQRELAAERAVAQAASEAIGAAHAERRRCESLVTVSGLDTCPTCTREIDEVFKGKVESHTKAEHARLHEVVRVAQEARTASEARSSDIQRELRKVQSTATEQATAYSNFVREKRKSDTERAAHATRVGAAKQALATAEKTAADVASRVEEVQRQAHLARAAVAVLSPTGVRAALLDRVLAAVEAQANVYGERLGAKRVVISGKTTLASGETRDKISLEVDGRPDPAALSTGERRRLDIAILFAFASVVGTDGEVILDEVFDGLDEEGVEAAADVLRDMARTRLVVVITHNQHLASRLKPDVRWGF